MGLSRYNRKRALCRDSGAHAAIPAAGWQEPTNPLRGWGRGGGDERDHLLSILLISRAMQ